MKFTGETKLFAGIIGVTVALVAGAIVLFSKPAQTLARQDVLGVQTQMKGDTNAKVFLVEFSDFQCPACKAAKPVVDAIVAQYKDKLVFGYRHFPLDQHPFAMKAAQAAEAAGQQGKFWEMYDLLFDNQEKFSDSLFPDLAKQLNLNMDEFTKAFEDNAIKQKIEADRAYGTQIGVNATPTFYLNGQKLNLTTFDDLKKAVEEATK
ncbi:thioredoxin domain-containing protein [Candidatus Gottesmanbacteria bacterium]|nr:thioredoxin domain-containing protein [Candidatus Gottesmanbacteria bacterium]